MLTFKQFITEEFNDAHYERVHSSLVRHYRYNYDDDQHIASFTHGLGDKYGSSNFNSNLHRGNPLTNRQAQLKDKLTSISRKFQTPKKLTVYRGLPKGGESIKTQSNGFTSTTLHPEQAHNFTSADKDGVHHIMKIHVPEGSHGIYAGAAGGNAGDDHSDSYAAEKEFIIPHGAKFKTADKPVMRTTRSGRKIAVWHSKLIHDGTKEL